MRRVAFYVLGAAIFGAGCYGGDSLGTSTMAQINVDNMAFISPGMTEEEVYRIMRKPYKKESMEILRDQYDVWFYVTQVSLMDQTRLVHTNLTPMTFKNKVLIGVGYHTYNKVLYKQSLFLEGKEAPPPAKKDPTKDDGLEKALENLQQKGDKKGQPPKAAPKNSPPKEKPPAQPSKNPSKSVSMAKKPKVEPKQPPEEEPSTEPSENQKKKPPLDRKDLQMLDEQDDADFNFW